MQIFPLNRFSKKLEDCLKENEFRDVYSVVHNLSGKARVFCSDDELNSYNIYLERHFVRFEVNFSCQENKPGFKGIKKSIFEAYAGEACVDVIINDRNYGAIPLSREKIRLLSKFTA